MNVDQEIREAALAHAVATQTSAKVNENEALTPMRLSNRIIATAYRYERFIRDGESALESKDIE